MEDIFDQLQEKLREETFDIEEKNNEINLLINAAIRERDFYKGAIIELESTISNSPAGWLDWSHLYEFVLWYGKLGGNLDKADEVCFDLHGDTMYSYFGLAFMNITDEIKRIVLDAVEEEDYEVGVQIRERIEDNWQPDDDYSAASFNNEYFDTARCNDYNLQETVEYIINEYKLTSHWIDSQLTEEEDE